MRQFFNTRDLQAGDTMGILLHGGGGAGKTWLLGSLLVTTPNPYVVNFAGEEGLLTVADLGIDGETIESLDDWKAFLKDVKAGKLKDRTAIGLDGLTWGYRMFMRSICEDPLAVDKGHYQKSHPLFENEILSLKRSMPLLVATARSDRSKNQLTDETMVTPDLPGRMAVGVATLFDFVFFLEHFVAGNGVTRRLYTVPKGDMVTRQRLPRELPPVILNPTGAMLIEEIKASLEKKPSPYATAHAETLAAVTGGDGNKAAKWGS